MIKKILKIIFPTSCTMCGKIYNKWICPKCYILLKRNLKFTTINEKNYILYYMCFYEGAMRKLLLAFKFKEKAYIANLFVEILKKNKEFSKKIEDYDYIISVPMHKKKQANRGYNQTEVIADRIEKVFRIKHLKNCLIKIKQNKKQSALNEKQRIENVKNVYKLENKNEIYNKRILLLDDIYTTGSTVKACIDELKKGKPKIIDVLVIAKRN